MEFFYKKKQKEIKNKPIGLILCSEKSPGEIKTPAYLTQLPEKKLLLEKLERAIAIAENNIKK